MYVVNEIYFSMQGEGFHTGRPAVFLRFAGCNLWSGRESDRASAVCSFCDTDFVGTDGPGGGRFASAHLLAEAVAAAWPNDDPRQVPYVVCTGGEPALQLDVEAIRELKAVGFEVAIETNGTVPLPDALDWVCVSPKAGADLVVLEGDELKLVYPQVGAQPGDFEGLAFTYFSLQPMDGPAVAFNTKLAMAYAAEHPKWTVSLQTHKLLGIP